MGGLTLIFQCFAEHQKLIIMKQLFGEESFDLAVRVDNKESWAAVCENRIVEITPFNVKQQLRLIQFLKVDHIRNIRSAVSQLEAVVDSSGQRNSLIQ